MFSDLAGVYAAAVTPLSKDFSIKIQDMQPFLNFLHTRGCHGVLLFGTTGEGPSFSARERINLLREGVKIKHSHPEFKLFAGTGTTSLDETIQLTIMSFELGFDGVVVLPPFYYRSISEDHLYAWYSKILSQAVPSGKALLGYHIPSMTGIQLTIPLLERLKQTYPTRFAGIKDSSSNADFAITLEQTFGDDLLVLNGNDRMFSFALQNSASGCITALANLVSPDLRKIWDERNTGSAAEAAQIRLNKYRDLLEKYPPAPALIKAVLASLYGFDEWRLKPPLFPLSPEQRMAVIEEFKAVIK